MEKIKLTEFGIIEDAQHHCIKINNIDVDIISIIPYEKILDMINEAMGIIVDDRPFISAPLYHIVKDLLIVKYYTNIEMSVFDKDVIDPHEVYETFDMIKHFNILSQVKAIVNAEQITFYETTLLHTLESIVKYKNSVKGIIDSLATDAAQDNKEFSQAIDLMDNPDELAQVKRIVELAAATK